MQDHNNEQNMQKRVKTQHYKYRVGYFMDQSLSCFRNQYLYRHIFN